MRAAIHQLTLASDYKTQHNHLIQSKTAKLQQRHQHRQKSSPKQKKSMITAITCSTASSTIETVVTTFFYMNFYIRC